MTLIHVYNKKTNTTYVYESKSVWNKELKQSRAERKLIGKLDKETGEIIPTGRPGRKKKTPALEQEGKPAELPANMDYKIQYMQLEFERDEKNREIISLRQENARLQQENDEYKRIIQKIRQLIQ